MATQKKQDDSKRFEVDGQDVRQVFATQYGGNVTVKFKLAGTSEEFVLPFEVIASMMSNFKFIAKHKRVYAHLEKITHIYAPQADGSGDVVYDYES